MRLPNPLAAYRRWQAWCFRRRMLMAGIPPDLADDIYDVYCKWGASGAERLAFQRLAAQCYSDLQALDGGLN